MLLPVGLPQVALAKVLAHWLLTGLPLILLSPIAAVLLSLEMHVWWALVLTLLLGTPILSCLGAIGVALTVGLRKGGTLLSLLILPLFLPVLIFAAAVLEAATLNMGYSGQLAIIGAILAITLTFSPFAFAGALRISLQQSNKQLFFLISYQFGVYFLCGNFCILMRNLKHSIAY